MAEPAVLLVNPFIEDFAAYDHFSKPLGLLTLAGYLKESFELYFINALNRHHPSIKSQKFNPDGTGHFPKTVIPKPDALKDIPRYFRRYGISEEAFFSDLASVPRKPDWVFVTSGMTYWYTGVQHTIKLIRQFFPEAKILLGGTYPCLLPGHAKEYSGADFVITCQDIPSILKEVEAITGRKLPSGYKNPAYELLGEYKYVPIRASSGCVFQCSYCAGHKLATFYQFPVHEIVSSVSNLYLKYGVQNFAFYDDALLFQSQSHLNVILEGIIKAGVKASFHTPNGLHLKFLTKETAGLMKLAGFVDLRLSLESAEPEFQKTTGGKAVNADFEKAMGILRTAGFERKNITVYTLMNVPGQDDSSVEKTMEYISAQEAMPMLAFYSPIPGTPDFIKASAKTDLSNPLSHNNTVYLYRSGFDMEFLAHLKLLEKEMASKQKP